MFANNGERQAVVSKKNQGLEMANLISGIKASSEKFGSFFDPVNSAIQEVNARMLEQADGRHQELSVALEHLLTSGGKRIRVAVTLLMGRLLRNTLADKAAQELLDSRLITLAAAIEMLHTATLVHDDLIDGALVRRGIPTLNAQWTPAATVLTGDFVFARAARLAAETDSVKVMRLFADTLATIVGGEIRQLFGRRVSSSREDYERRIYAKTASLFETATLATTCLLELGEGEQFGLSDLNFDGLQSLTRKYGYNIGMAFQVVDDILDFTGEQAMVGKPVGSDLRQGIITLPAIVYFEHQPDDPDLKSLLSGKSLSEINFDRLLTNICTHKLTEDATAIDIALNEAQEYTRQALKEINRLPESTEKRSLIELAGYITKRKV